METTLPVVSALKIGLQLFKPFTLAMISNQHRRKSTQTPEMSPLHFNEQVQQKRSFFHSVPKYMSNPFALIALANNIHKQVSF